MRRMATGAACGTMARADLFQYIEGIYNQRRLHPGLGYLTPEQKAAAFQSTAFRRIIVSTQAAEPTHAKLGRD